MKLKDLATGNITKKQLAWILLPPLFLLIIFWTIARSLYPLEDGYFIDYYYISRQGTLAYNPVGGWFFIISTSIAGFSVIFFTIFVFRRLWKTFWPLTVLFLLCGVIGGLGLIFVGISPEEYYPFLDFLHHIGSIMAFSGMGLAILISIFLLFIRIIIKKPWPSPMQFFTFLALILQFVAMFLFINSSSVQQWTGFYIIFVWLIGLFLILPDGLPETAILGKQQGKILKEKMDQNDDIDKRNVLK